MRSKEEVREKVNNGIACYKQYGFSYKDAGASSITKEEALQLLDNYNWDINTDYPTFYEIELCDDFCKFIEYSENDLM